MYDVTIDPLSAPLNITTQSGNVTSISVTPTVTPNVSYVSGYAIGNTISFVGASRTGASQNSGVIQAFTTSINSGVLPSLDVILFNANPTNSTIVNNANVAIANADVGKIIGVAHLNDYTLLSNTANPSFIQNQNLTIPFSLPNGNILYAAVITRTGITFGSNNDVITTVRIFQD